MLEVLLPAILGQVFPQVAALVESGRSGGYHYESHGGGDIVRIVERYLAEYRSLLQEAADWQDGTHDRQVCAVRTDL
jgi:hypothetical protein